MLTGSRRTATTRRPSLSCSLCTSNAISWRRPRYGRDHGGTLIRLSAQLVLQRWRSAVPAVSSSALARAEIALRAARVRLLPFALHRVTRLQGDVIGCKRAWAKALHARPSSGQRLTELLALIPSTAEALRVRVAAFLLDNVPTSAALVRKLRELRASRACRAAARALRRLRTWRFLSWDRPPSWSRATEVPALWRRPSE